MYVAFLLSEHVRLVMDVPHISSFLIPIFQSAEIAAEAEEHRIIMARRQIVAMELESTPDRQPPHDIAVGYHRKVSSPFRYDSELKPSHDGTMKVRRLAWEILCKTMLGLRGTI